MNPTEKAILVILVENGMLMTGGSQDSAEKMPKKWEGFGKERANISAIWATGQWQGDFP